jgi:UDP-N-acetylglucosamine 2-epimerase (non-hydrolysing)
MIKVLNIAGARPNFMKIAPLVRAMEDAGGFDQRLIHTGQHYDEAMSKIFFDDLGIPAPHVNLDVGSGERLAQIDRIMSRFEPVLQAERPAAVLVVGDVNSTVACARVAKAHGVRVIHVEAGLRSFDTSMPEELNRVETDQLSDLLFVTEQSGMDNLIREGVSGKAMMVGNVMIDTLVRQLPKAEQLRVHRKFGVAAGEYLVATFHRPSNVDSAARLAELVSLVRYATQRLPMVLPLHPRTRAALQRNGLLSDFEAISGLVLTDPLGYLEFLSLVRDSRAVITDSGGIQEETTYLSVPCITMRDNTERPVTVECGTNILAGSAARGVQCALRDVLGQTRSACQPPPLWDGHAAERIVAAIKQEIGG